MIILGVLILSVVVSFLVLFTGNKKTAHVVVAPSYKPSVEKILKDRGQNEGDRLTQKQLLDSTEYVLNSFYSK